MSKYRPRYRKPRRKINKRIIGDIVLIVVLIGLAAYLLFFSELFKIKEIEIVDDFFKKECGNILISKLGNNLLLLNINRMEQDILDRYLEIDKVVLKKDFPSKLILSVEKRIGIGVFCCSEHCLMIDSNGLGFKYATSSDDLNIYGQCKNIGENVISKEMLDQILFIKKGIDLDIKRFVLINEQRLNVEMDEGWEIYFDLSLGLDLCLTKLNLLLEQELPLDKRKDLQYIDLRFSKVYYK